MLKILLKIAYDKKSYNKDLNVTHASMCLIGNLIEICEDIPQNRNIIQFFFSDLYNRFENSLNISNFSEKEEQICYQDSILSVITSCCGEYQKITMNTDQIICVFNLIDKCLQQRGCIFEQGLIAMSSLSFFGWDIFSNINNNVMKYVLYSLEERQNFELCYQGLLAADEIIRNVGKENLSNIPKIVEKIEKIINDENIPRGLKIKCFALYADIFNIDDMSNGDYLNGVLQLIVNAMNSSIDIPADDIDQDTLDYLSELRERRIEKPRTRKFSYQDLINGEYKLPFVFKNEKAHGGCEKFLIATEHDYEQLIKACNYKSLVHEYYKLMLDMKN